MRNLTKILVLFVFPLFFSTLWGQVNTFPDNTDFESGLGFWKQSQTDGMDWTIKSGKTTSSNTGPSGANGGSY